MTLKNTIFNSENYRNRVEKQIPGLHDLHRMVGILLTESIPEQGNILALGAGGGLELTALRQMNSNWRFAAIDPSSEMITQAKIMLKEKLDLITFTEGYIEDAPGGPFDGATALLVLHFLNPETRLKTLKEIHKRLRPGAPLIVVHHSFELSEADKWLHRYADFQINNGAEPIQTKAGALKMKEMLPVMSPNEDEDLFHQAGFEKTELFYTALSFKGWITYASGEAKHRQF